MKRILPMLVTLNACEPDFRECVEETSQKYSDVVSSPDLVKFSESVCSNTRIALDIDGNGRSSVSELCKDERRSPYEADCRKIEEETLTECVQDQLPGLERALEPGNAVELARKLCSELDSFRKSPPDDDSKAGIDFDLDGSSSKTDCDESSTEINPRAEEVCDNVDNNCNGIIDLDNDRGYKYLEDGDFWHPDQDGDGYGVHDESGEIPFYTCKGDKAPEGMSKGLLEDCDDSDSSIYTGAEELIGDNKDNNCNGLVDESLSSKPILLSEEIADSNWITIGRRGGIIPHSITPDQYVVRGMQDFALGAENNDGNEWILERLFAIKNDSVSPTELLGYSDLFLPAIEKETRTFCEWITPMIDAKFASFVPEVSVSAQEMLDHSEWYLAQYPAQGKKEAAYYKSLQGGDCGRWDNCEDYFIDYRPGSKWKIAEAARIRDEAWQAGWEERREKGEEEDFPEYGERPKPDIYRGLEAMLYRRINNGVKPEDLRYCAETLEKNLKSN